MVSQQKCVWCLSNLYTLGSDSAAQLLLLLLFFAHQHKAAGVQIETKQINSYYYSFFSERIVNLWNNLPTDRIGFSSLYKFKKSITSIVLFELSLNFTEVFIYCVSFVFLCRLSLHSLLGCRKRYM